MPPQFEIAVVVPNFALPTKEARAVLPDCYSSRPTLCSMCSGPRCLSQPSRRAIRRFFQPLSTTVCTSRFAPIWSRDLADILRLRKPGLLGCALSGAGPAVLVFYERGASGVCELVRNIFAMNGCTTEVISSGVSRKGYEFV